MKKIELLYYIKNKFMDEQMKLYLLVRYIYNYVYVNIICNVFVKY